MITVIIKDNDEPKVTQLTYENLWRELKDIPGAQLIVSKDWFAPLKDRSVNKYICLVEPDCLVSSGYFASQIGLLKKDAYFRKLAILSSVTGVNNWANRFYGYTIDVGHDKKVTPVREKRSNAVDSVQIAYVPGSIVRASMLKQVIEQQPGLSKTADKDLVLFSTMLSLGFWRQGDGNRVHLNPNAVYVTTESYVNDLGSFVVDADDLLEKFERESI